MLVLVFYLGINDCGCNPSDRLGSVVGNLFQVVYTLSDKVHARNVLFVDVPPLDRSPGGMTFCLLEGSRLGPDELHFSTRNRIDGDDQESC